MLPEIIIHSGLGFDCVAGFFPAAKTAVHGDHVRVSHFLQVVGRQGGTVSPATVQDEFGILVGDRRFDVAFDNAFSEMDGPRDMSGRPFAFFPDVDEYKGVFCV